MVRDWIKNALTGTAAGQRLNHTLDVLSLLRVPTYNPEQASARANHLIARKLICGLCPPRGQFMDVGAHIGSVFDAVHRADASIAVTAVEADPQKAEALRKRYPYATILPFALGESTGTTEFHCYDDLSGYNSLIQRPDAVASRRIEVQVARLDDLFSGDRLDLVKIDVEGAELGVLRGAEQVIARTRPVIMFESVGRQVNTMGYDPGMIWDWLAARDYLVSTPDRVAHDAQPLGRESFLDGHDYPFRTHDYFAIPQERRIPVRDRARDLLRIVPD